jgi:hypothetical protein
MDTHEAILEQLRLARLKSLEAIADRLTPAAESLDVALGRIRAAVQDLDPAEADAVLPLSDVENAVARLGERLRQAEARAEEAEQRAAALSTAAAGGGMDLEVIRALDAASSQSELLRELLPLLAEHAGRAVVLVVRAGRISAWSGIGFADGEVLRSWDADPTDSAILDRFVSDGAPVRFEPVDDPVFAEWLAHDERAEEALLLPVVLRGKMMGGLYVDRVADRSWDPLQAQALVALACWMIDTLHHRQQTPSAMLADPVDLRPRGDRTVDLPDDVSPGADATAEAQAEPEFDPSATMRVDMTEMASAMERPAEVDEVVPEAPSDEPEVAEPPPAEPEMAELPDEPPVEEAAPIEPPVAESAEPPPVTPVQPPPDLEADEPPPVQPVQPPPPSDEAAPVLGDRSPEDEARHEEARRFARLLVSEIKLYNEDEVDRGRANSDLYSRLQEDIDRSREMYEKRIPEEIRSAHDYFQDELVRILADGDADALGM